MSLLASLPMNDTSLVVKQYQHVNFRSHLDQEYITENKI